MSNPLIPSAQPGARPASEHRKTAREIGNATREAERILDDIAGTSYDGGTAMRLVSVLRRLTNASRAAAGTSTARSSPAAAWGRSSPHVRPWSDSRSSAARP